MQEVARQTEDERQRVSGTALSHAELEPGSAQQRDFCAHSATFANKPSIPSTHSDGFKVLSSLGGFSQRRQIKTQQSQVVARKIPMK